MKMMMFAAAIAALAATAPASAQMATGASAPAPMTAGAPLPKCSATVRDSCDQSTTTERNAMSADQAMKTGGVGDRKSGGMAMPTTAKPMMRHKKHRAMHHKTMTTSTTTDTAEPTPK